MFLVASRGNTSKDADSNPSGERSKFFVGLSVSLHDSHNSKYKVGYSGTLHENSEWRHPGKKSWEIKEAEAVRHPWAASQGGSAEEAGLMHQR